MTVVNILGTEYTIQKVSRTDDAKLKNVDGYCDSSIKKIVVVDMKAEEPDVMDVEKKQVIEDKILAHEIIHAFLNESGLMENSEWAQNEEMVDWIAIQFQKILVALMQTGCLNLVDIVKNITSENYITAEKIFAGGIIEKK